MLQRQPDKRLLMSYAFAGIEPELYRAGREAFILMAARTCEHALDLAGAIGPYEYRCSQFDDRNYVLVVEEIKPS